MAFASVGVLFDLISFATFYFSRPEAQLTRVPVGPKLFGELDLCEEDGEEDIEK